VDKYKFDSVKRKFAFIRICFYQSVPILCIKNDFELLEFQACKYKFDSVKRKFAFIKVFQYSVKRTTLSFKTSVQYTNK